MNSLTPSQRLPTPPPGLLDPVAIEAEQCRRSLRRFFREAWNSVEPARPYKHNWHIDAIADHLEAQYRGEIPELVINMPPGYMKSMSCTVMAPVWRWINAPGDRFMCFSYSSDLALEHSRLRRLLIQSRWYQERYGHLFRLVKTGIELFTNNHQGMMVATSVGGSATGFGGEHNIGDDLLNPAQAASDADLKSCEHFFRHTMGNRLRDKMDGTNLLVMQRLHEKDTAGLAIELGWQVLLLPAEYDPKRSKVTCIGWTDPRKTDGELLWPAHEGPEQIAKQKELMGPQEYARQYQQVAVRDGGNYLKLEWWKEYAEPQLRYQMIVQSIDSAMKTGKENDYSVVSTFGVTADAYDLLDVWQGKVETPELERQIVALADKWKPTHILGEDTSALVGIMQSLSRKARLPFIPIKPDRDKVSRCLSITGMVEAGRVRLPARADWLAGFLNETSAFPLAPHDDIVDTLTQFLNWIRENQAGRVEYTPVKNTRADKYGGM